MRNTTASMRDPARGARPSARAALVLSAGLVVWSLIANLVLGDTAYTLRNVALTAGLLIAARRAGLGAAALGLTRERLSDGLRWGVGAVVAIAVVVWAGVAFAEALPFVPTLLADERAQLEGAELAIAVLVRIPLGTALFEEVVFRGLLLAVFLRCCPPRVAVLASSVVFGLWHIAPTAVSLELNGATPTSAAGMAAIAGTVALTTVAGLAFTWLRWRSGSLLAPVLAHWATNALGLLAAATA
jgi:uncharacterized protein